MRRLYESILDDEKQKVDDLSNDNYIIKGHLIQRVLSRCLKTIFKDSYSVSIHLQNTTHTYVHEDFFNAVEFTIEPTHDSKIGFKNDQAVGIADKLNHLLVDITKQLCKSLNIKDDVKIKDLGGLGRTTLDVDKVKWYNNEYWIGINILSDSLGIDTGFFCGGVAATQNTRSAIMIRFRICYAGRSKEDDNSAHAFMINIKADDKLLSPYQLKCICKDASSGSKASVKYH